jgi:hypothetical protein
MAFFTRRGASSVPEIPSGNNIGNVSEISEEDAKKFSYIMERDGVEV